MEGPLDRAGALPVRMAHPGKTASPLGIKEPEESFFGAQSREGDTPSLGEDGSTKWISAMSLTFFVSVTSEWLPRASGAAWSAHQNAPDPTR